MKIILNKQNKYVKANKQTNKIFNRILIKISKNK